MVSQKRAWALNGSYPLFESHSGREYVRLINFLKIGKSSLPATRALYFRMLAKACDTNKSKSIWMLRPQGGITRPCSIEHWLREDEFKHNMNSADLLDYFAASTLRGSLKTLIDSGLVRIDLYNRMHIRYPVDGKLLSLEYAAKAIKSKLKKQSSLDTQGENSVKSDTVPDSEIETDDGFWNK